MYKFFPFCFELFIKLFIMQTKKTICMIVTFLWITAVDAQIIRDDTLRGSVLNSNGEDVVGAVVSCIALPDSTIVGV